MQGISIGRLAKLANVSIDTIRFYEKAGLFSPHARRPSGRREYSPSDLKQLRFIRRGRLLGLSLDEIGELLALEGGQGSAIGVVQRRLHAIDRRIEELKRWRTSLVDFLDTPATAEPARQSILDCFDDESVDAETSALGAPPLREAMKRL
jgi:MerR family transcriptional regulator, copper efflux regulator